MYAPPPATAGCRGHAPLRARAPRTAPPRDPSRGGGSWRVGGARPRSPGSQPLWQPLACSGRQLLSSLWVTRECGARVINPAAQRRRPRRAGPAASSAAVGGAREVREGEGAGERERESVRRWRPRAAARRPRGAPLQGAAAPARLCRLGWPSVRGLQSGWSGRGPAVRSRGLAGSVTSGQRRAKRGASAQSCEGGRGRIKRKQQKNQ